MVLRSVAVTILVAVVAAQNPGSSGELPPLEVGYMLRGYFYAASPLPDEKALGGFAPSDNLPRRADPASPAGRLSIFASPGLSLPFEGRYRGFPVTIANTTDGPVAFAASDSRLAVVREALAPDGEWKPVEYLPSSWCGNSYHQLVLPAGHAWHFTAPVFAGSFATRMRFKLVTAPGQEPIYSPELAGSVDPRQFVVKQGHTATNLMDPYED